MRTVVRDGTDLGQTSRSATEQRVVAALEDGLQLSAADDADRTGVSRATAQRYLSQLADGVVAAAVRDDGAARAPVRQAVTRVVRPTCRDLRQSSLNLLLCVPGSSSP